MVLRFNPHFLLNYLSHAPLALALERVQECRIFRALAFHPPVLDLGCGDGLFARMLFADPPTTGIDLDADELETAETRGGYREVIRCRADRVPKPDGWYRTIYANSVLEHIRLLNPVFKEMHRLLAPQGKAYVTVPTSRFEQYTLVSQFLLKARFKRAAQQYRRAYNRFWKHYHAYPTRQWLDIAEDGGFRVIDWFTYNSKAQCMRNDLLVPLSSPAFVTKKLTRRWVLSPASRRIMLFPLYRWMHRTLPAKPQATHGGLLFMALEKA